MIEITIQRGISLSANKFLEIVSKTTNIKVSINTAVSINLLCLGPTILFQAKHYLNPNPFYLI